MPGLDSGGNRSRASRLHRSRRDKSMASRKGWAMATGREIVECSKLSIAGARLGPGRLVNKSLLEITQA